MEETIKTARHGLIVNYYKKHTPNEVNGNYLVPINYPGRPPYRPPSHPAGVRDNVILIKAGE